MVMCGMFNGRWWGWRSRSSTWRRRCWTWRWWRELEGGKDGAGWGGREEKRGKPEVEVEEDDDEKVGETKEAEVEAAKTEEEEAVEKIEEDEVEEEGV